LPNDIHQQPEESPASLSENGNSGTTFSDVYAVNESSTEMNANETETADRGQQNTTTAPSQNAGNTTSPPSSSSSAQPIETQKQHDQTSKDKGLLKKGIGIQCGIRFHRPKKFNDFVTDMWNSYLADISYSAGVKKTVGPGLFLSLNGTIDIGPLFQITPFAQGMWAGKQFYFTGGLIKDIHVNTYTAMGGLNLWVRVLKYKRITLRLGAGGYGAHTIVSFTGDISETKISGSGWGIRGLLGTELRLTQQVVITLDCSVPYGVSKLNGSGQLKTSGSSSVDFPSKFEHFGFEIFPGVMFYF
jgi:hypothetical protein